MKLFNFKGFKKKPNAPWSKYYKEGAMNLNIEDTSLYNYFEEKIIKFGNVICLDYYGRKIRYTELLNNIDDCARGLYDYGIRKGDVVKIDGNMAIAWSGSLDFTVERSGKSLVGSAASGEGLVNVFRGTGKVLLAPVDKVN